MRDERVKIVVDNEKHIAEEKENEFATDEEDVEGMDDSDEEEKEYKETLKKLSKARERGANIEKELEDDYNSDDDSDYEYTGGDLALYDSALDATDELLHVK